MKYTAIIFDFFGVISSEVAPRWLKKNLPVADAAKVREKYIRPVDVGEISENDFFERIAELTQKTPMDVRDEWISLASINSELVRYIKTLHKYYKVALCSAAPTPFLKEIIKKNNLSQLFDTIIISSGERMTKPNPAIFKLVLEKLGTKPEETVFVDDNVLNIDEANTLGIKSFVFSNLEQLKKDFKSLGIMF